jgi:hypothetical protein
MNAFMEAVLSEAREEPSVLARARIQRQLTPAASTIPRRRCTFHRAARRSAAAEQLGVTAPPLPAGKNPRRLGVIVGPPRVLG